MNGYITVNLKEIEDLAPRFGLSLGMQARFARVPLGLENSGISYFRLAPGFRQPSGHRHEHQEEVYVLVGGSGRAKLGDELVELGAWDAVRVPPHTPRAFEAGPEGLEIIVLGAPNTENRDVEPLPDWWMDRGPDRQAPRRDSRRSLQHTARRLQYTPRS